MLVDLHVVHERNRLKLIKGERVDPVAMASNTKLMTDLKKAMGIHPEQLIKRTAGDSKATIADAAGKFDAMPPALRDQMWLEELLLLFQQYHTPSPREDGDGYQLDDIGLFGQTRCRTCACSKCGQKNFVGINIDEVTDYLAKKGTLEELEPEPPVTIVDIPVSDMADDELSSDA
jgi:hypothetical protein